MCKCILVYICKYMCMYMYHIILDVYTYMGWEVEVWWNNFEAMLHGMVVHV